MFILFAGLSLLNVSIQLYKNLSLDRGKHNKAKLWLIISVILLTFYYVDAFVISIWGISKPEEFLRKYHVATGIFSSALNMSLTIAHTILGFLVLYISLGLAKRKLSAKKILMWTLPFMWILESLRVYRDFMRVNIGYPNGIDVLGACLLVSGIVFSLLYLLYDSMFMEDFFEGK
jgi:hypothetical protein